MKNEKIYKHSTRHKNMYQAIMENDVTTLQCLAYNGLLDVHRDNNYPIRFACCNGNTEAATFLLQHVLTHHQTIILPFDFQV